MIRTTALPAAALLGLTLLAPTSAHAAVETCQGRAATIIGTDSQPIVGTEGADVIVTNGASLVDALGGDDLVCVTGAVTAPATMSRVVVIDAAAGNDSVEVSAAQWSSRTELGDGADTFVAGNGVEQSVRAGRATGSGTFDMVDTEPDVIRVTPGSGEVVTGLAGVPNADIVELAAGGVSWAGHQVAPGSVVGGDESRLSLSSFAPDLTINAQKGTVASADTSLAFSGVTGFDVTAMTTTGSFSFRGSHRAERLTLRARMGYGRYVAMGGADDVYESDSLGPREESTVRGNGGRDRLLLNLPRHRVDVDLDRARVVATGPGPRRVAGAQGFEDLTVAAMRADVAVGRADNEVVVVACRATVEARAGKDLVAFQDEIDDSWDPPRCSRWRAEAFGGRGADTLLGGPGNDRLVGGPGKDRVEGRGGRDGCEGEQRRTCEKRA